MKKEVFLSLWTLMFAKKYLYIFITQNGGGFLDWTHEHRGQLKYWKIFPNILMLNFAPLTVLLLSDDNRVNQGLWNQANWIENCFRNFNVF